MKQDYREVSFYGERRSAKYLILEAFCHLWSTGLSFLSKPKWTDDYWQYRCLSLFSERYGRRHALSGNRERNLNYQFQ